MLPIVFLVWGIVFYQLYLYFFSTSTYVTEKAEVVVNVDEIKKDTFSIVANYRDPFLGENIRLTQSKTTNNQSSQPKVQKNIAPKPIDTPWPTIEYKGMIKNNNSEKRVGIVGLNNKEYLVKEGEVLNGVKFMVISKELIQVSFQKEQKTISK
jgi:hypothetical protein